MAEPSNDGDDPCISSFFVESLDVDSTATTSVNEEPLLESEITNQMSQQQEFNDIESTTEVDSNCTEAVTSFQDGQEVELDDGSTAYIFHQPKDNYPAELIQPVQVNGVMTAYIYRPDQTNLSKILGPGTSKSDDEEPMAASVPAQTSVGIKEIKPRPSQTFQCDRANCKKFYSTAHHLKVHKRSHTGEKPYVCNWENCKKVFTTSYALKSHLRVHTGEKPYVCPLLPCKKGFKTSGDLHKHIRTHTGEKPFKCPFEGCGKAFTTSNICKVHIRTHTGERPHKCPFSDCPKSFTNITNYKNHVRIHTGEKPYVCSVGNCGKQFTEYSSWYKHQIVHSVEKPYTCNHCGKMYRQISTLILHKKKSHKGMDEDFLSVDAKNTTAIYSANSLNPKLPTVQTSSSNAAGSTKTSSVVVVPVNAMTSSCIVMNNSIDTQFQDLPTQETEPQIGFVTENGNPETVMLSMEAGSNDIKSARVAFQTGAERSNEETLYTDEDVTSKTRNAPASYSPMVLPSSVVASEDHQETGNAASSDMWMKMNFSSLSSNQQETEKQTDQQFQVATLVIDGTKYLVQVYDETSSESNNSSVVPTNANSIATASGCSSSKDNLTVCAAAMPSTSSDHDSYFVTGNQASAVDSMASPLSSRAGFYALQIPTSKASPQLVPVPQGKKLTVSSKTTNLAPILSASKQRITVKLPRKIRPALTKQRTATTWILPKLPKFTKAKRP